MAALINKLKHYRHKLEMNQKEFAKFLGVDLQHYNDWENQRKQPSLQSAYKISKKLNCHIEDLYNFE